MSFIFKSTKNKFNYFNIFVKRLLSVNYFCESEWADRFNQPCLTKLNSYDFFFQINDRFKRSLPVEAVDIDLFINIAQDREHLTECAHFLKTFRKTRRTAYTLDSTSHAVCRLFLKFDETDQLIKMIEQRVEYGIFPDHFCFNMLMDHLLKKQDFRNAARVAIQLMLQEDFSNSISNILAINSIYSYLQTQNQDSLYETAKHTVDEEEKKSLENVSQDEDEVIYLRVPYLRNPYFDDHFDITNPFHLCGKTLWLLGRRFDSVLGRSLQILGLAYYNKWKEANDLFNEFKVKYNFEVIVNEVIDKVKSIIENLSDQKNQEALDLLNTLKSFISKFSDETISNLIQEKMNEISSLEQADIDAMKLCFEKYKLKRDEAIKEQMDNLMKEEAIKQIKQKRKELSEKEKRLYFFENFAKHEMDFVEAEKRIAELKLKTLVEEEYFPPKI